MKVVIEVTPQDIADGKSGNVNPLMAALGRAGFKNAFVHPETLTIVSATVSHIEALPTAETVAAVTAWNISQEFEPGFHELVLSKPDAVAFGLHVHDGLERRERDELINPEINPEPGE